MIRANQSIILLFFHHQPDCRGVRMPGPGTGQGFFPPSSSSFTRVPLLTWPRVSVPTGRLRSGHCGPVLRCCSARRSQSPALQHAIPIQIDITALADRCIRNHQSAADGFTLNLRADVLADFERAAVAVVSHRVFNSSRDMQLLTLLIDRTGSAYQRGGPVLDIPPRRLPIFTEGSPFVSDSRRGIAPEIDENPVHCF